MKVKVRAKMMKRWILGGCLAIALLVTTSCGLFSASVPSPSPFASPAPSASPALSASPAAPLASPAPSASPSPLLPPQVDSDRLFQHVEALNFERYTDLGRDRTRRYLAKMLTSFGWKPQLQAFEGGVNVLAQRSGRDAKAGTILVSAHYDTVAGSPGADDNGTSIAAILEIARLFGSRQTQRSLQLVFFDREEAGLVGSLAFTASPKNLVNLDGVVNLEMLGYACHTAGCQKYPEGLPVKLPNDRGDFVGVVGDQEHLPLLNAFQVAGAASLPPIVTLPIPFKGLLTPDVLRSDHAPFWAKNIGAVMVGDTANFRNPHYHQPSDTPETLDRAFFTGATQRVVNAVTVLLDDRNSLTTAASN